MYFECIDLFHLLFQVNLERLDLPYKLLHFGLTFFMHSAHTENLILIILHPFIKTIL